MVLHKLMPDRPLLRDTEVVLLLLLQLRDTVVGPLTLPLLRDMAVELLMLDRADTQAPQLSRLHDMEVGHLDQLEGKAGMVHL